MKKQKTPPRLTLFVTPENHKAVTEIAQKENRSISNLMETILLEWLEKRKSEQDGAIA